MPSFFNSKILVASLKQPNCSRAPNGVILNPLKRWALIISFCVMSNPPISCHTLDKRFNFFHLHPSPISFSKKGVKFSYEKNVRKISLAYIVNKLSDLTKQLVEFFVASLCVYTVKE